MKIFLIFLILMLAIILISIIGIKKFVNNRKELIEKDLKEIENLQIDLISKLNTTYSKYNKIKKNDTLEFLIIKQQGYTPNQYNSLFDTINYDAYKVNNIIYKYPSPELEIICDSINSKIYSYNSRVMDFNRRNNSIENNYILRKKIKKDFPKIFKIEFCKENENPNEIPSWMKEIEENNK